MLTEVTEDMYDPANPSGRGDWWNVFFIHGNATVDGCNQTRYTLNKPSDMLACPLDDYIVERAMRGCADCLSTILECPDDPSLQAALVKARSRNIDTVVA